MDLVVYDTIQISYGNLIIYKNAPTTLKNDINDNSYWLTVKDVAIIILEHQQPHVVQTSDGKMVIPLHSALHIFAKMELEDFSISSTINTIKQACNKTQDTTKNHVNNSDNSKIM